MEEVKLCKRCGNHKPLTKEFWHACKRNTWNFYCKECVREKTKANYNKNKEKWNETTRKNKSLQRQRINEYKDNLCCLKCGEPRNWLLDFHHVDPKEKDFQISQGERFGWEKIQKELEKCIPLCSNCHRDFHYQEKHKGITINKYLKP